MAVDTTDPRYLPTLRRALTSYAGSNERWATLAARGATDEELTAQLNHEFGLGGGTSGPGWLEERHSARPPRVWIAEDRVWTQDKPNCQGAQLLALTRRIFGIGRPDQAGQLSLFDQALSGERS